MTDEYIRKQDVVDYCKALMNAELVQNTDDWGYGKERYNQTEVILEFIENRQPADVVQAVHGKWTKEDRGHVEYCAVCDQCGFDWMWSDRGYFKFCPNCGAKMDGERKE